MGDLKLGNVSVQMKLVADVQKKGEGAKVVTNPVQQPVAPRVDIKTEVETGGGFEKTSGSAGALTPSQLKNAMGGVNVGAGGGVLGHLLATRGGGEVPDPARLSNAELKKLLEPFIGRNVVVTNYDKDEASSLGDAAKKGGVADTRGKLAGVDAEGIVLDIGGRKSTLQTEFWAVARIKIDGDGPVLAQDPAYAKHYMS